MGIKIIAETAAHKKQIFIISIIAIFIPIIYLCCLPIIPSLDGCSHLYSSKLFLQLIVNNQDIVQYHSFNHVIVPNLLDHILLSFLLLFLPALIAQKVFYIIVILFFWCSYVYVLRRNNYSTLYSILIIPIIFSHFFYVGFYNQLFGFSFFILCIQVVKEWEIDKTRFYVNLFVLSIGIYLCSIIIFFLLLAFLGITFIFNAVKSKQSLNKIIKTASFLLIIFIPTLILSCLFLARIKAYNGIPPMSIIDKMYNLVFGNYLVSYRAGEILYTAPIIFPLILCVFVFIRRNKNVASVIFLILLLMLYFIIPSNFSAGMVTERLGICIYLLCAIILPTLKFNIKHIIIFSTYSYLIFIGLFLKKYNGTMRDNANFQRDIYEIGSNLPPYTTVWPINLDENWFNNHCSNLVGIKHGAIDLENYEPSYPWFPIVWNKIWKQKNQYYYSFLLNNKVKDAIPANCDFVLVIGNHAKIDKKLSLWMRNNCLLIKKNNAAALYKVQQLN